MKNKTASILYILILLVVVLEIVWIWALVKLDSTAFSMAAQSNVGVVVFSTIMCDVVGLYNGQNSKTV